MVNLYIPKQGDIIFVNFSDTLGHEKDGNRPAIVISNDVFNRYTNMVIVCPISSNTKEFPTHYKLEDTKKIHGSVFCEHIRSIDYHQRRVKFVEKASVNDLLCTLMIFNACLDENDTIL